MRQGGPVGGGGDIRLRVERLAGEEAAELAAVATRLRGELLNLDVAAVEPVPHESGSTGAKGIGAVAGDILVWLGPAGLGAVLTKVADWARRGRRVVEVTVAGDTIKLGQATKEQQDRLVEAFVAQHSPGS